METELVFDGPDAPELVVLAHGAGAPMDSPFMQSFAKGLAARDLRVCRFEFPYMQGRRESGARGRPDPASKLLEHWRGVIGRLGPASDLVIGGKSMGGRIASMVADECGVRGLVCLGYPFHPPGRPERLRTAHLEGLRTPTLILQGTRDALGDRAEIEGYKLSDTIRIEFLEDGDHSFKPRVRSGHSLRAHLEQALDTATRFVTGLRG